MAKRSSWASWGLADGEGEFGEGHVCGGVDDEVFAVGGLELLCGDDAGEVVAGALSVFAGLAVVADVGAAHAPDGFVEGLVDVLAAAGALPGLEGEEGAHGGEGAGGVIGDEVAGPDGRAARFGR